MNSEDPLDALLVDHREINREKLARILEGKVGVDPENEKVLLYSAARRDRTIPEQVMFLLLGQRVLNLYREDLPKGLKPQEISEETGIKGGSLRPALARLSDDGLVVKREGRYLVPSHALDAVEKRLGVDNE